MKGKMAAAPRMSSRAIASIGTVLLVSVLSLRAARAQQSALPSEDNPPTAPCLDDDQVRKGVQKKTFLKRHRVELIPQGGLFASDLLSSSYVYGGTLAGYFTEDFGLEV